VAAGEIIAGNWITKEYRERGKKRSNKKKNQKGTKSAGDREVKLQETRIS